MSCSSKKNCLSAWMEVGGTRTPGGNKYERCEKERNEVSAMGRRRRNLSKYNGRVIRRECMHETPKCNTPEGFQNRPNKPVRVTSSYGNFMRMVQPFSKESYSSKGHYESPTRIDNTKKPDQIAHLSWRKGTGTERVPCEQCRTPGERLLKKYSARVGHLNLRTKARWRYI